MAREEFTVRITRKGEIIIEMENLPPRRVKDLVKYLEETVGPARQIETDDGESPGRVEIDEALGREESEEEVGERPRERLREEDGGGGGPGV